MAGGWRGSPNSIAALTKHRGLGTRNSQLSAAAKRALSGDKADIAGDKANTKREGQAGEGNPGTNASNQVRLALSRLMKSGPASARVSAARTLAEMDGLLGKHSLAPDRDNTAPIEALSREDLTRELARLREAVALGLVGG